MKVHLVAAGFFLIVATSATSAQNARIPRLEIYGFVMADFVYDFRTNNPEWFDVNRPSKLPSFQNEFGRNGKTYAGVRQTQFGVKGYQSTSLGELKTWLAFDFFGVGPNAGQTTISPRYFYAEIGALGVGQTDSPFMDIDVFPNTLDYWGPNGMLDYQNVQVRWMPLRGETRFTLALERPGSTQDPGLLANRTAVQNMRGRFPLPDFTGEYRQAWKRGYVKGSWVLRKTMLDDLLPNDMFNLDDSVIGWGGALSSNLKLGKDILRLQYVFGQGIENYVNDAPVDIAAKPNMRDGPQRIEGEALPLRSLVAFLDHGWTDKWTTCVGYSQLVVDNTVLQRPDEFHRGQYAIVNLLYSPQEHILYGGEAQWGRRTNSGDGFHANDYRIQFSFKFRFYAQIGGVK